MLSSLSTNFRIYLHSSFSLHLIVDRPFIWMVRDWHVLPKHGLEIIAEIFRVAKISIYLREMDNLSEHNIRDLVFKHNLEKELEIRAIKIEIYTEFGINLFKKLP